MSLLERMSEKLPYKCKTCCEMKSVEQMTRRDKCFKTLCNTCSIKKSALYKSGEIPKKKQRTKEEQQAYNKRYYLKNKEKIDKANIEAKKNRPDFKCPFCETTIKYGSIWSHKSYGCSIFRENKWKLEYREVLRELKSI